MSAVERADGECALQGKMMGEQLSELRGKINTLHVTLFSIQSPQQELILSEDKLYFVFIIVIIIIKYHQ